MVFSEDIYQASFCQYQVSLEPFFLTKTAIAFLCDVVATFLKLFLLGVSKTKSEELANNKKNVLPKIRQILMRFGFQLLKDLLLELKIGILAIQSTVPSKLLVFSTGYTILRKR